MKRRLLIAAIVILFLWVVFTRLTETRLLLQTLARGQWEWILIAVLLQVIYYTIFAAEYRSAFDIYGISLSVRSLLPLVFSSIFLNVVAPSGGASGAALFVDDAARRGASRVRAASAALLQLIAYLSGFSLILVVGLAYLFVQQDLTWLEVAGAVLLLVIILGLGSIFALGLVKPGLLARFFNGIEHQANRLARLLCRPGFLRPGWAERNAAEFKSAAEAAIASPGKLARTIAISLAAHFVDVLSLYAVFMAFGQPISIGPLTAGFAIGILFWIVSITPQGIGVVEGMMTLVFTSLGIGSGVAATVSLAFRGLSFWLPFFLGFVLIRRNKAFSTKQKSLVKN